MKDMKKAYIKPIMENEKFIPNQFIAACENPESYVGYCDISGEVWTDGDGDGKITRKRLGGKDKHKYTNTACGQPYESITPPTFNAWVVNDWKVTKYENVPFLGKVPVEWEAVNPIAVFNYMDVHVTQHIDTNKHYNVSI